MPHVRFLVSALTPLAGALALAGGAVPAAAQYSRPVVQGVPGGDSARLNAALGRLARNPRDVDALVEAGMASLAAGDGEAAIGFYQKADAILPGTTRIKAGLAGAYAVSGDAASAIPLFDAAERLGLIDAARTADRGLAFDMVGDPVTAQRYYREALMAGPNDETSRRFALSQAISGDRNGMETTLSPLLQKQDKAAWRTRAFALAILGQAAEAESIARSTMPADMAAAMTNYLRYMTRLTPAQQAAAANLGKFPRAAEIGRADPQLAALVRTRPVVPGAAPSRTAVVAAAAQRSDRRQRDDRRSRDSRRDQPVAPATQPPVAAAAAPLPTGELPPLQAARTTVAAATPAPAPVTSAPVPAPAAASPYTFASTSPPVGQPPRPVASATLAAVTTPPAAAPSSLPAVASAAGSTSVASVPPVTTTVAAVTAPSVSPPAPSRSEPGFASLDTVGSAFPLQPSAPAPATAPPPAPVAAAAPAPRPAPPPAKARSLSEVFADLTPPSREAEPAAGAVDLRKIKSAPAAKLAETKPAEGKSANGKTADSKAGESKTGKLAAADCDPPAKGKPATKGKAAAAQCKPEAKALAAAKEAKEAKDSKAREKASPSRYWVQVATGRDKKALAFDWRKLVKEEAVLKGRKAFTTPWGQANRLMTGPFETAAQANAYLAQVKKAGLSGAFVFNSPAGQDVDPLAGT